MSGVTTAMAEGEIAPDEAAMIAGVIEIKRKTIETADIERRLAALEQRLKRRLAWLETKSNLRQQVFIWRDLGAERRGGSRGAVSSRYS
jgi:hypothetical protein